MSGIAVVELDAHPESRVQNSQPHGIGRVVALGDGWAWNNLGRNVVFAGDDLAPRAVYDESPFREDEPSQYDLDVHAILDVAGAGIVVTLNHLGSVRAFDARDVWEPGPLRRVSPRWTRQFRGDVERAVVVGGRLVGSRPRHERAPGLLAGGQLTADASDADIEVTVELEMLGVVTALSVLDDGAPRLIVGADGVVSLVPLTEHGYGEPSWHVRVDFEPSFLEWDGERIWAAGSERADRAIDDYDWEARRGGGFAAIDPTDGAIVVDGRFPDDVAWGNGGIAVVRVPNALCSIGRTGRMHVFDDRRGTDVVEGPTSASSSLGIGHAAARRGRILYGFNRGGYRLYCADVGP
ncbi:MAG TPA: hypothetical protein VH986_05325 [Acidimicrobiia bacterium]